MTTRIQRRLNATRRPRVALPVSPARPGGSFGRDVLVNVLANLIAAGVVYLAAVAAGYVTADKLRVTAVVLGLVISAVQVFVSGGLLDRRGRPAPAWARWVHACANAAFFGAFLIVLLQALR